MGVIGIWDIWDFLTVFLFKGTGNIDKCAQVIVTIRKSEKKALRTCLLYIYIRDRCSDVNSNIAKSD